MTKLEGTINRYWLIWVTATVAAFTTLALFVVAYWLMGGE